eukprot:3425881-Rhodomonas_salina.3
MPNDGPSAQSRPWESPSPSPESSRITALIPLVRFTFQSDSEAAELQNCSPLNSPFGVTTMMLLTASQRAGRGWGLSHGGTARDSLRNDADTLSGSNRPGDRDAIPANPPATPSQATAPPAAWTL